jgi:hypothetical protein
LEIVFPVVLGHPRSLEEGLDGIAMVASEALPTVLLRVQGEEFPGGSEIGEPVGEVEFDSVDGVKV